MASTAILAPESTNILDACNETWSHCFNHRNYTNETLTENVSFVLPLWRQIMWSMLFGSMVVVATGGNLITIWIVVTNKRMRTVTNYFIVNLAVADAMVSSLNVTFNYIYMLHNDWPFGEHYCKISQFIATLSISASVFTLVAISLDRYVAIMQPLRPRMSKRCNLTISAIIWIVSTIISYPMYRYFTTVEIPIKHGVRTICYSEWPDGTTNYSQQEYMYNIAFMCLTYVLPIMSMTLTYSRVGIELWGHRAIGEYALRQMDNIKSKRKVVKMMIVVVLIFGICWLPFHTYFIVTSCYPAVTEAPHIQEVYLAIYWLAMSNSMYNPIIYCWMNSRFRYGFKLFFRWCPFVHVNPLIRRNHILSRYSCSGSPDQNRTHRRETQRSLIYTCRDSRNSSLQHCGKRKSGPIRSSTAENEFSRDFHQRGSLPNSIGRNGTHELSSLCDEASKHNCALHNPVFMRGSQASHKETINQSFGVKNCDKP